MECTGAYTDFPPLSCLVNYSSSFALHITQITRTAIIKPPDFSLRFCTISNWQKKKLFLQEAQKAHEQWREHWYGFSFWGCAMRCIVRYINLPPTLCRSEQTVRLLFVVLPQQCFYLSCETAIQIDEVQQHDIFSTSITLRSRATWVKSQQTITFPDISSPHSDRWWILSDKAFIIRENREFTKISSLFFSPPVLPACPHKSRWTSPLRQNRIPPQNRCRIFTGNQKVCSYSRAAIMVQWAKGHIKWKQLFCASPDLILVQWDRLLWKWAMTACHWRLALFYHLSPEFNAPRLCRYIKSPYEVEMPLKQTCNPPQTPLERCSCNLRNVFSIPMARRMKQKVYYQLVDRKKTKRADNQTYL